MPTPSSHPGLGANPYAGGVSFRYWAPFAGNVPVMGINGDWNPPGFVLASEGNGYWSGDFAGIGPGHEYNILVNDRWRMDPRARDVTHTGWDGKCIVNGNEFQWRNNGFGIAAWNDLVISEMHLGTFPDN